MDVLKEIAQAEGRAKEIEREFRKKSEDLVQAARGRLELSRIESEKTIERQVRDNSSRAAQILMKGIGL